MHKNKHRKQTILNLTVQHLENTAVQWNIWHTGPGIEWTGKKSYWLEEGEEVGEGRAGGLQQQEMEGKLSFTPA